MITDREKLVLGAIIDYYLTTGETVGSRTLVKKYNIDYSSATIRNVMADLEDMGYLEKTHTSSGRIPTDMGCKFYLSELLKIEKLSRQEMEKIHQEYDDKIEEFDGILRRTSNLLSRLTSYAGIVLESGKSREKIKRVELVYINDYMAMAVIIMEDSTVRTRKIYFENQVTQEELRKISLELNEKSSRGEVETHNIENFVKEKGDPLLSSISNEVYQDMAGECFINGTSTIFEDKTVEEAKEALEIFNKRKGLEELFKELVGTREHQDGKVYIVFGDELKMKALKDFSFVYSFYTYGDSQGIIGVIGPKRMAYSKTIGLIEYVTEEVRNLIKLVTRKGDNHE
jgi:heat-inducible transcriptional repressor